MNRNFLSQFLSKISNFPTWAKEIIYNQLSEEVTQDNPVYEFSQYKPVLTYKGRCELDFRKSGFDTNIYNILQSSDNDCSISDIVLNTYLSMEEVAKHFLFCVDEGFFEIPDNSQILNIAGFLTGKYRTGEYLVNSGTLSANQLDNAISQQQNSSSDKKLGQHLIDLGFITKKQIDFIIKLKEEAQKRFILDHNEVPKVESNEIEIYKKKIEALQTENKQLKTKLEQLLVLVKRNDE